MPCDWLHFAERTGKEGQQWALTYRNHLSKVALSDRALHVMRKGDLKQGKDLLEEFARQLDSDPAEDYSIRAVLDRWYHGVAGYYYYCSGHSTLARRSMDQANASVMKAIGSASWLAMLAIHCQEFCLHQARIARNQRDWHEMHTQIARAQAMMEDRIPLCETADGRNISFASFNDFFAALAPLSPEESEVANKIIDHKNRIDLFDRFVRGMLKFPEVAIQYP